MFKRENKEVKLVYQFSKYHKNKILWYYNVPLETNKVLTESKLELLLTLLLSYLQGSWSKMTVIA